MSSALALDSGFMSYPNIYFGHQHIGGIDDLKSHLMSKSSIKNLKRLLIIDQNDIDEISTFS